MDSGLQMADDAESIGARVDHVVPVGVGARSVDVLAGLMREGASLRPFVELAERVGVGTEADALRIVEEVIGGAHATRAVDAGDVRRAIKREWRDGIIRELRAWGKTPEDRHQLFLFETADLNPVDRGHLAEVWYRQEHAPNAVPQARLQAGPINALGLDATSWLRADRRPDLVDGSTLIEIKSHRGPFGAHDKTQIEDYLRAFAGQGSFEVTSAGQRHTVQRVKVVMLDREGAIANLDYISDLLRQNGRLDVELFNRHGERRAFSRTDVDDIQEFLGR